MSKQDPKQPVDASAAKTVKGAMRTGAEKQSGRVAFDARGNPVWQWKTDSGAFDADISTQRLKKVAAELSLEKTNRVKKLTPKEMAVQAAKEAKDKAGGGFNPYNSGSSITDESRTPTRHPVFAHKQKDHPTVPRQSLQTKYANQNKSAQPQSFWQKLKAKFGDR